MIANASRNAGSGCTRTKSCLLGLRTGTVVRIFLAPAVSRNSWLNRSLERSGKESLASVAGLTASGFCFGVFMAYVLQGQNVASSMSKLTGFFGLDFARESNFAGIVPLGGAAGATVGTAVNCSIFTGGGRIRRTAAGRSIQSMIAKIGVKILLPCLFR